MAAGEVVNPSAGAPAAAAPAAPAAAPSAPAAPSADSGAPQGPAHDESTSAFFNRVLTEKNKATPEVPAAEQPVPAEGEPKPEDKPADAPAEGEPKPEDKPAEDKKPEDAPADDVEELSLEPDEVITPRDLSATLEQHPEVLEALEKAGLDRNKIFATARIATKGAKVLDLFGDLETAQDAHRQAEEFGALTELFTNQNTVEDTQGLLGKLMEYSYVRDEDGNPVEIGKTADGQPIYQSDGTVARFVDNLFQISAGWLAKSAEKSGNVELKAALDVIEEHFKQSGGAPVEKDYSHLEAEVAERLKAADAREKEVANREAAEKANQSKAFEVKVGTGIEEKVQSEIDKLLSKAALTQGQKDWAAKQIQEKAIGKLANSKLFFSKVDALRLRPMSDKTLQARVAHGINSLRPLLPAVAREVLKELGAEITSKREADQKKHAAQTQAARSDIKAGSQPAKPQAPASPAQLRNEVISELTSSLGREPKEPEILTAVLGKKRALGLV